ncbi:hypothetical protein [Nocardia tengchongensis]|uniref:hypothetical protein n=1 Tax=Nocardia tengchongensis TaxID=2055889 RepID=UPI003653B3F5
MFIADRLPPKDLNSPGVNAFGLVWCRSSTDLEADMELVRTFITNKGWNPPPLSYIHPVHEVVTIGWADPTPLNTMMLNCAYSRAHAMVVPDFRHLPDGGDIIRGVIDIVNATTGQVMTRPSHEAQWRRIAGIEFADPNATVRGIEDQL